MALANQLAAPIGRLITAADRVRDGDLLARVPEDGPDSDEFVMLSRAFNRMTSQLDSQRRELIEANRQLDERRRFTETVLAGVSAGVIGTDAERRIVLPNRAAQDFLGEDGHGLVGTPIDEVLPGSGKLSTQPTCTRTRSSNASSGLPRPAPAHAAGARVAPARRWPRWATSSPSTTSPRLLSAQRQAAWAEVARRIAHEVKNPLTPIRLSAERLERKYTAQIAEDREASPNRSRPSSARSIRSAG